MLSPFIYGVAFGALGAVVLVCLGALVFMRRTAPRAPVNPVRQGVVWPPKPESPLSIADQLRLYRLDCQIAEATRLHRKRSHLIAERDALESPHR